MKPSSGGLLSRDEKRSLPLSRVYALLEPGPVILLITAFRGRAVNGGRKLHICGGRKLHT